MIDRHSLRVASSMLLGGLLLTFAVGLLHADNGKANDHVAAFTHYANSDIWTVAHLGQFVSTVVVVGGLTALFYGLGSGPPVMIWLKRFGLVIATAALATYAALQAVDGVALKQSVDTWLAAPASDAAARFGAAEAIRWVEWGLRSYFSFLLGFAFVMGGIGLVRSAALARAIGYLMALTGGAYIAQGWIIGNEGFSTNNTVPTLAGYGIWLVWAIWFQYSTSLGGKDVTTPREPAVA
jgi:hypothetical protein